MSTILVVVLAALAVAFSVYTLVVQISHEKRIKAVADAQERRMRRP